MAWVGNGTSIDKQTGYTYEGKEIALTKTPGPKARSNGLYQPEVKRIEAATVYAVTKDLNAVEELVGVPKRVLEQYLTEPWFQEIVNKVKKEKNELLDAKLTSILEDTFTQLEDRIKGGEYYVDRKTKQVTRIPVRTKDLALASEVVFDKRQLLRGEATNRVETVSQEDKLLALKEQFERLAVSKGINPKGEIYEGERLTHVREAARASEVEFGRQVRESTGWEEAGRLSATESQGQEVNAVDEAQIKTTAEASVVSAWKEGS